MRAADVDGVRGVMEDVELELGGEAVEGGDGVGGVALEVGGEDLGEPFLEAGAAEAVAAVGRTGNRWT